MPTRRTSRAWAASTWRGSEYCSPRPLLARVFSNVNASCVFTFVAHNFRTGRRHSQAPAATRVCAGSTPFDRPGAGPDTCAPARPRGTGGGGRVLRRKVRAPCCSRAAGPCARGAESRESETRHAQTLASRDWHIQHTLYTVYIHRAQTSVLRPPTVFRVQSTHSDRHTDSHAPRAPRRACAACAI